MLIPSISPYLGLPISMIIALVAYKKKSTTIDGCFAMVLLGTGIHYCGGLTADLPLLLFFVIGSALSKFHPNPIQNIHQEEHARTAQQVLANGLTPLLAIILYYIYMSVPLLILYFGTVGIHLADTMSSEIGTYKKRKTYDLLSWKPITQGLSGGVSLIGLVAAAVGGLIMGILAFALIPSTMPITILTITAISFSGALLDSLLGKILQVKYLCRNGHLTEKTHCHNAATQHFSGQAWANNSTINLLSALLPWLILSLLMI